MRIFGAVVVGVGLLLTALLVADYYWVAQYGFEGSAFEFVAQTEEHLAALSGRESSVIAVLALWFSPMFIVLTGFALIRAGNRREARHIGRV